ncbi:MAG: aminomethyl transferase family protein [Planctomycetia bacterium]|nr:aminomethyl transferase family protein [Planctomycetia bacterium]
MSDQLGNPVNEYTAAVAGAALFDLSHWTQLELTGADRAKFLHNFCTNDIKALAPGNGCEAFVTNVQGKILAHLFVYAGEDSLFLISAPGTGPRIVDHLSRYQINEDVAFRDLSAERGLVLLAGPCAATTLRDVGCEVQLFVNGQHQRVQWGPAELRVFRNDLLRLSGFLGSAPPEIVRDFSSTLVRAGAVPAGAGVFNALRIAAGFPLYGVDLAETNLAQEANLTAQAISFSKGCYLGQEPIARIDALGHVNQQMRILRLDAGPVPAAGTEVLTADAEPRPIGRITSAELSYATDRPIALAFLKRNYDTPGLKVGVPIGGVTVDAEVYWPE